MAKVVSIIVPIFNATKEQLSKSIGSAISQTYSDIEVIAINDCSNNSETTDALCSLEQEYFCTGKLRVYNSEVNRGIASSRNKGIEIASGDYICFLDQDDYYDPEYVSNLLNLAIDSESDVAMCGFTSLDEKKAVVSSFPKEGQNPDSKWYPWSVCAIWNRIYNKRFLDKNNIRFPDGCVTEDIVFLMQCNLYANKIAVSTKKLYCNVVRKASTSHSKSFHSLSYDQMPIHEVQDIISNNLPCSPYLYAYICNEMTLLCTILTIGTDTKTLRKVSKKAGELIRISSKGNSIKEITAYNNYCRDKKIMQLLIFFMTLTSRVHIEKLYVQIIHILLKIVK